MLSGKVTESIQGEDRKENSGVCPTSDATAQLWITGQQQ